MKKELDDQLVAEFPILYKFRNDSESLYSITKFGFEHQDGWYNLIYSLSEKLEKLNQNKKKEPIIVHQSKSKFGGLRVYCEGASEKVRELINETERESLSTCEACGKPGVMKTVKSWVRVRCESCA